MRSGQTQNRIVETFLESPSQYCILVKFEACSQKLVVILSNSITCHYVFKHTATDLKRESRMHENW